MKEWYKVVATSNFADETYAEKTKIEYLSLSTAKIIATILNEELSDNDRTYYTVKAQEYKLWRGMEELV